MYAMLLSLWPNLHMLQTEIFQLCLLPSTNVSNCISTTLPNPQVSTYPATCYNFIIPLEFFPWFKYDEPTLLPSFNYISKTARVMVKQHSLWHSFLFKASHSHFLSYTLNHVNIRSTFSIRLPPQYQDLFSYCKHFMFRWRREWEHL